MNSEPHPSTPAAREGTGIPAWAVELDAAMEQNRRATSPVGRDMESDSAREGTGRHTETSDAD